MIKQILIALVLALGVAGMGFAVETVDINTASVEELADALHGVGLSKAEAIVAYREANGPFTNPDELVNVRGIGMRTVDRNRDRLIFNNPQP